MRTDGLGDWRRPRTGHDVLGHIRAALSGARPRAEQLSRSKGLDLYADAVHEALAGVLAAERERVLTIRRELLDDDRCACEDCIRYEFEPQA